ncbi:trehalose-phosphatase [Streptomyces sp. NPDC052052]|uniref:trehalose-phosphatase n=1 Tax=Streptomyces sp. NPDC052052 TaxID=3154756 RepID=UPI0034393065
MGSNPHVPAPSETPSELPTPTTRPGREALAAILARPDRAVIALDFDGTLADIVPDPEQARAHPGTVEALAALAPEVASIAVITGRPADVAVRYGGFAGVPGLDHLVVLGHYGAERWDAASGAVHTPAPHPGIAAIRAELPCVLDLFDSGRGAWIEEKGQAIAVHTRRAADPQVAFETLSGPLVDLAARHGLIVEPGRLVLELRPPGMDKGVALARYLREADAESVLYAGDDLGDLAAYATVEKLRAEGPDGIPGLLVCSGSAEVPELAERADLLLNGPGSVVAFLAALARRLQH